MYMVTRSGGRERREVTYPLGKKRLQRFLDLRHLDEHFVNLALVLLLLLLNVSQ